MAEVVVVDVVVVELVVEVVDVNVVEVVVEGIEFGSIEVDFLFCALRTSA